MYATRFVETSNLLLLCCPPPSYDLTLSNLRTLSCLELETTTTANRLTAAHFLIIRISCSSLIIHSP